MAIQTINLGAPITGEGGDTYRDAHTKINANFSELNSKVVTVTQVLGQSTALAVSQKLFTDNLFEASQKTRLANLTEATDILNFTNLLDEALK